MQLLIQPLSLTALRFYTITLGLTSLRFIKVLLIFYMLRLVGDLELSTLPLILFEHSYVATAASPGAEV